MVSKQQAIELAMKLDEFQRVEKEASEELAEGKTNPQLYAERIFEIGNIRFLYLQNFKNRIDTIDAEFVEVQPS